MMKTLIFNASPRKNGDTAQLLASLLPQIPGEYKVVDCYRADISPCVDCRYCWQNNGCAILDGMQDVYRYIQACDNILIASPIYFSELTGKMLDVGSRLQTYFCARHFRRENPIEKAKKGAVLLVGGGDGSPETAARTARILLRQMGCTQLHDAVCSLNTNQIPAIEDPQALQGLADIAHFFSE